MNSSEVCVIIGASHAGVNCAFALRKENWEGRVILIDSDSNLPYHRPPLSKAYLSSDSDFEMSILKSKESYIDAKIDLRLGLRVVKIDAMKQLINLSDGSSISYDRLVLAVGAKALLPTFTGMDQVKNLCTLRKASDAIEIRKAFSKTKRKRVVVVGGGYIGLETAASLRKLGAEVIILERESRVLARVTAPEMSDFFSDLHAKNGVSLYTDMTVKEFRKTSENSEVLCSGGKVFNADIVIIGIGIKVNVELALEAGLEIEDGICVDGSCKTSDPKIYAIGDCTYQFSDHYGRKLRLESVQNAVDQAKIAARSICNRELTTKPIPWFWSDQYDVKLQMVGLSEGYNDLVIRHEKEKVNCLSVWYFKDDELLSVDAVNNARAYVLGGKFIKSGQKINKANLSDQNIDLRPDNILLK